MIKRDGSIPFNPRREGEEEGKNERKNNKKRKDIKDNK